METRCRWENSPMEEKHKLAKFGHELYADEDYEELISNCVGKWQCTLIAGNPYIGKTRFLLYMTEALAAGRPFFWSQPPPKQSVLLFTERTTLSVKKNLEDLSLDLSALDVTIYSTQELPPAQESIFTTDPPKWVLERIRQHHPTVAVMDTFGHFMPPSRRGQASTIDYGEMRHILAYYNRMAFREQCTFFLAHHTSKKEDYQNLLSKVSGSNAIVGNTLSTIILEGAGSYDPEKRRWSAISVTVEYHHGRMDPVYLKCNDDGTLELAALTDIISDAVPPGSKQVDRAAGVIPVAPNLFLRDAAKIIQEKLGISRERSYRLIHLLKERGDLRIEVVGDVKMIRKSATTVQ
jgi:hypothetical protein